MPNVVNIVYKQMLTINFFKCKYSWQFYWFYQRPSTKLLSIIIAKEIFKDIWKWIITHFRRGTEPVKQQIQNQNPSLDVDKRSMSNNKDPKTQIDPTPQKKETKSTTKEKDIRQSLNMSKKDNFGNSQKADSSRWNTAKKDARDKRLLQVMIANIMVCSSLLKKIFGERGE